jgi:mannose-6-phosphate isomerase-like protein (cupin superfamily)
MTDHQWLLFDLPSLLARIEPGSPRFQEILRTPSLSCSIYHLPAGSKEMQSAHEEDELYLVLEGRARLRVGDEDQLVQKGSIMYVHTACDHAFFDIEEDLTVLAFFGAPMRFGQSGTGSGTRPGIGIQADPEIL